MPTVLGDLRGISPFRKLLELRLDDLDGGESSSLPSFPGVLQRKVTCLVKEFVSCSSAVNLTSFQNKTEQVVQSQATA